VLVSRVTIAICGLLSWCPILARFGCRGTLSGPARLTNRSPLFRQSVPLPAFAAGALRHSPSPSHAWHRCPGCKATRPDPLPASANQRLQAQSDRMSILHI